jgi:hypothetical protein
VIIILSLETEKTLKLSLLGKYKKPKKNPENPKKPTELRLKKN